MVCASQRNGRAGGTVGKTPEGVEAQSAQGTEQAGCLLSGDSQTANLETRTDNREPLSRAVRPAPKPQARSEWYAFGVSQYPSHLRSQEEEIQGDWSCSGQSGVEKKLRASEGDIGHGSVFGTWGTVGRCPLRSW